MDRHTDFNVHVRGEHTPLGNNFCGSLESCTESHQRFQKLQPVWAGLEHLPEGSLLRYMRSREEHVRVHLHPVWAALEHLPGHVHTPRQ